MYPILSTFRNWATGGLDLEAEVVARASPWPLGIIIVPFHILLLTYIKLIEKIGKDSKQEPGGRGHEGGDE